MDPYERHSTIPVETILPLIDRFNYIFVGNIVVPIKSIRLRVYRHKGIGCVMCGVEGAQFAVERNKGLRHERWHLNLYCESGRMMTVDHIIPKSKGGPRTLVNLQPMCSPCNNRKGDRLITPPVRAI